MKKLLAAIFLVAAPVAASVAAPASAHAVPATGAQANLGQCHQQVVTGGENAWYSPGRWGNGPIVLVNGEIKLAAAFDGGFGCYL